MIVFIDGTLLKHVLWNTLSLLMVVTHRYGGVMVLLLLEITISGPSQGESQCSLSDVYLLRFGQMSELQLIVCKPRARTTTHFTKQIANYLH